MRQNRPFRPVCEAIVIGQQIEIERPRGIGRTRAPPETVLNSLQHGQKIARIQARCH
jgi:hypothetical protein